MINVLFDSCSLYNLIDIQGYSKYLTRLENLIESRSIRFFTHELIHEEWKKHKEEWTIKKQNKLLGANRQENKEEKDLALIPYTSSLTHSTHIYSQISQIEKLLASADVILSTPIIIKNEFAHRYRKGLAPFHNKKDSQNDWEIIGSFFIHCQERNIDTVYFISGNPNDFASLSDKNIIHPDFQERFPELSIQYYCDYVAFFRAFETGIPSIKDVLNTNTISSPKFLHKASLKKNVLDSLCSIYKEMYEEINFVPIHLLKKLYPFTETQGDTVYYDIFTLHSVSDKLTDFLNKISVSENGIKAKDITLVTSIKDFNSKIKFALVRLTKNLIHHVTSKKYRKKLCVHYFNYKEVDCPARLFDKYEISKTLTDLKKPTSEYKEQLKNAYIHYQLGNYDSANEIYDSIVLTAPEDQKFISYFIAKYNQHHLSKFIQNPFYNDAPDWDLANKLKLIDPLEEAYKLKAYTDYNLLTFISQEDFFSDAFQEVTEIVTNIKKHYHSQLYGGWSSNQYIWELINAFVKLNEFINQNYIIYNCFSNYTKLMDIVTEGLFASYSISKNQNDKLDKLDNYWINTLIQNGDGKSIVRIANLYNIDVIKYEDTDKANKNIVDLFNTIITEIIGYENNIKPYLDKGNLYLKHSLSILFINAISVAGLLDLDSKKVESLAKILLEYLESQEDISFQEAEAVRYFMKKKGNRLKGSTKYKFLTYYITRKGPCENNFIITILQSFTNNELSESIKNDDFLFLLNNSIGKCKNCGDNHTDEIFTLLFSKVKANMQKLINFEIKKTLRKDFNFELYHFAVIFDVIKLDKRKLFSFIDGIKIAGKETANYSFFGRSYENNTVDKILNISFKHNLNTTTERYKKFAAINPYYEWLIDMDKFDYTKFNEEWVLKYGTKYYYKRMSKSKNLINALRSFLRKKNHPGIENVLLRITNFYNS